MDKLKKGEKGDWQKEGYTIHHIDPDADHNTPFNSKYLEHLITGTGMYVVPKGKRFADPIENLPEAHRALTDGTGKLSPSGAFIYAKDHKGDYAGHVSLEGSKVMSSAVMPEHRRKGLATAMYQMAEGKTGKSIKPDTSRSEDAKALWSQKNRPFGKSEDFDQPQMIFVAIDGDSIGQQVGRAVLADDVQALHEISGRIDHVQEIVQNWVQEMGGEKISGGGDECTMTVPAQAADEIEQLRKDIEHHLGFTISVGVGSSLSEAGKSLLVAKFRGKNQIAIYDDTVESEIAAANQRVADGTASDEERKIASAYLEPKGDSNMEEKHEDTCPYCQEMDGQEDPDHCQECHGEPVDDGCPYCAEADEAEVESPEAQEDECPYCQDSQPVEDEDSCPYCAEEDAEEVEETPVQSTGPGAIGESDDDVADDSQDYEGADLNAPDIDKPELGDEPAPEWASDTDVTSQANETQPEEESVEEAPEEESIYNPDTHSKEAMQAIVQGIEDDGNPTSSEMDQMDDEDAPTDGSMDENVSHPDGYEENTPSDLGLSEDEVPEEQPDVSGVLQEGLDNHADNIQKEKVVQMVGQALEGFKASKDILEKAKEQAPQLYQSSIAMLKAMIEMAKMLGLGPDVEQGEAEVSDPNSPMPGEEQVMGDNTEEAPANTERPEKRDPSHFGEPEAAPAKKMAAQ